MTYYKRYIDGQRSRTLTVVDGDVIVGYITLRTTADYPMEHRFELVIVDESRRGCGLVESLFSMAARYAFDSLGVTKVSLGVFENNPSAIHCYKSAVFRCVTVPITEIFLATLPFLGVKGGTALKWNCTKSDKIKLDRT